MTGVLAEVSMTRQATVMAIPLQEAVTRLRRLAIDAEIRHSNDILRLLAELDAAPVAAPARALPSFFRLVEPIGHHGYQKHVSETQVTRCGMTTDGWRDVGRITPTAAAASDGICRRCQRSVKIELEEG